MTAAHEDRRARWLALAVAAVTLLLFARTWGDQMLYWDDSINVLDNPLVTTPGWAGLKIIFTSIFSTDYYPITYISLAIDHWLWHGHFIGYHVTQTILHASNAGLVLWLAWRWTRDRQVATLAAAWFGWHPVQVETVAWVAERKNALGLCFVLLTWLVYLRAREAGQPAWYRLVAVVLFTAAVLSHALVIVLPGLLVAYELTIGRASVRAAIERTWLFFIPAGFAAVMRILGHSASQQLDSQFNNLRESVPTMFSVLGQYLTSLVWPLHLNNYYVVHGVNRVTDPALLVSLAWLVLWIVLYWRIRSQRRWLLFGAAWFLIALAPVSQIVPHPTLRADRYLYVAAIVPFVVAALILARHRALFGLVTVVSLSGCLWLTCQRMPVWHDPISLWTDCVTQNPRTIIGYFGLASAEIRERNYPLAEHYVQCILNISPNFAEAQEMLGGVLLMENRPTEAREHLERALAENPQLIDARNNLDLINHAAH